MPASSQASSELSTASLTAVRRAFLGLSKPSRCLFFAKNSLTDMSRCFAAIDSAVTARRFGCSPVSLTFGIFVCSSILPDFTLVFMRDRSGPDAGIRPEARGIASFGRVTGHSERAVRASEVGFWEVDHGWLRGDHALTGT